MSWRLVKTIQKVPGLQMLKQHLYRWSLGRQSSRLSSCCRNIQCLHFILVLSRCLQEQSDHQVRATATCFSLTWWILCSNLDALLTVIMFPLYLLTPSVSARFCQLSIKLAMSCIKKDLAACRVLQSRSMDTNRPHDGSVRVRLTNWDEIFKCVQVMWALMEPINQ